MDDTVPFFPGQDIALHAVPEDLIAIAARLRDAGRNGDGGNGVVQADLADPATYAINRTVRSHLALARKTYALRRKRAAIFGNADLFGEPAWDILLDLFIAHGEGKPVSVSSACIGSAAPATTGLRWLAVLADEGLILRESDPQDQRRVLVRLSPSGLAAMTRFFDAMESGA
jgi:hypothetical protein